MARLSVSEDGRAKLLLSRIDRASNHRLATVATFAAQQELRPPIHLRTDKQLPPVNNEHPWPNLPYQLRPS